MNSRRALRIAVALAIGLLLTSGTSNHLATGLAQDQSPQPGRPQQPVSLRDRLIVGLRAMSKADTAFVDRVVLRVQSGQLPQRLVDETFFWARDRAGQAQRGNARRPIIYFRPAMTARAQRIGVAL
jgi:hypothetical protein